MDDTRDGQPSAYEIERKLNIERNRAALKELGLADDSYAESTERFPSRRPGRPDRLLHTNTEVRARNISDAGRGRGRAQLPARLRSMVVDDGNIGST